MLIDDRHFLAHHGNARVGRSSGTRGYSSSAHGRSAWIAARERPPFFHHGSSTRSDPPSDADSRPHHSGSDEGANACAVARIENIERVRSVANATRQKRQATVRQNTPLQKLDDELLAKENRCIELRQRIKAKKQEFPVRRGMAARRVLSSSHLAFKQRVPAPGSDGDSLQALQAELLRKEEECATGLETLILLILDL
jgi:hypothetical protein